MQSWSLISQLECESSEDPHRFKAVQIGDGKTSWRHFNLDKYVSI